MDDLTLINNTSVYRNPASQSPLQGPNVLQPATVYSKIMLRTIELAENDYVFDGLATERTMPSNNGANEITFKRMLSLAAHTQPLVEGIPPASDQGRMVAIKGSTKSYGRVMKFTDKVNWAVVDPLISEYTRQLSLKIPEMKDLLAQEALLSECQTFYAQHKKRSTEDPDILTLDGTKEAVTHIMCLTKDCNPSIDEFRQIVLSMEAAKVRPHSGSNFLALVSSAVMYDLITDKRVKEFMKFSSTGEAYKADVVIDLFSLAFKKAKTIKTDNTFIDHNGNICYLYSGADGTTWATVGAPKETIGSSDAVYHCTGSSLDFESKTGTDIASLKNGFDPLNVHHSFVIGEECLYRIGVEGHTAPQFIKKELGSAGTEDPLNQRQSIGWKIDSLGYKVVNPDAVVDYMSIPTQYRVNVNARPDMKNQFTDYYYGYVDATGRYFHPEQVVEYVNSSGKVAYRVRGTTIEVNPIKMTELVKPVNGGRLDKAGKKNVVVGRLPQAKFALESNHTVLFEADQVVKHTDGKFYIKGLAGTAAAKCVELPTTYTDAAYVKADGTGVETRTAIIDEGHVNEVGDDRIDK